MVNFPLVMLVFGGVIGEAWYFGPYPYLEDGDGKSPK